MLKKICEEKRNIEATRFANAMRPTRRDARVWIIRRARLRKASLSLSHHPNTAEHTQPVSHLTAICSNACAPPIPG